MDNERKAMRSIKAKLIGTIAPGVVILVVILIVLSYLASQKIIRQEAQDMLQESLKNQASQIESWLEENLTEFNTIKTGIEQMNYNEKELQQILDTYYGFSSDSPEGVYLTDGRGNVMQASQVEHRKTGANESVWYQQGLTRVNMAFGKAYQNEAGQNVISASAILRDGGEEIRVISADVLIDHISIIVNSFIDMDEARAFLVDNSDGTILAHDDSALISANMEEQASDSYLGQVASKLEAEEYDLCSLDGNMTAFDRIQGTDWVLVSYVSEKSVYAQLYQLRTLMTIIAVIAILLLILLIERMVHVVIHPVKALTKTIVNMAEGDFTVDVEVKGSDEISIMGRSVKVFLDSMGGVIAEIRQVAEVLRGQAKTSEQVSGKLYDVSVVQTKAMTEMNSTVEQLAASVQEIAESATTLAMVVSDTREDSLSADRRMKDTVVVTEQGRKDMEQVEEAMKNIECSILRLQEAIDKVGTASLEINKIVALIGTIAEETNLLSLNASIEAARAGEAGKGFAVVATEIGKLAQTSAASVSNISTLIQEVNVLVSDTVSQAKDSSGEIAESGSLIHQAVATFHQIYENIQDTNEVIIGMIDKIGKVEEVATNVAAISEEQAASTDEIQATAENMVSESRQITENSEMVSKEAGELLRTSDDLMDQMKTFRI